MSGLCFYNIFVKKNFMTDGEILGLVGTAIGLVLSYIALKKDHFSKPKDELENLEVHFRVNQTLSTDIQKDLEQHIIYRNCGDQYMRPGVTLNMVLGEIRSNHEMCLSDEVLERNKTLKLTKPLIQSMTQSLQDQYKALIALQQEISYHKVLHP